jgi:probable F420-dependent oxidoreductase
MGYGLSVYGNDPEDILALARRADELGYDSIWIGEHVVAPFDFESEHPYPRSATPPVITPHTPLFDVWVLASMILGATHRIRVATGVLQLPLRPPLLTARASISAWELSGGRFILGVGLGWMVEEYRAMGVPFEERAARYDEALSILQRLWAGGPVEHPGPLFPFGRLQMTERAVDIPLVLGGTSRAALRRAAVRADGWYNPGSYGLEQCSQVRAEIDQHRAENGRSGRPFTYHIRTTDTPTPELMRSYQDAGFHHLVLSWQSMWSHEVGLDKKLKALELTSKQLGFAS